MGTRAGSARELKLLAEPMRAVPDQHHVKALLDAGLLERKPQGRTVWYSIAPDQADRVAELLPRPSEISTSRALLDRISAELATRFSGAFPPSPLGSPVTG